MPYIAIKAFPKDAETKKKVVKPEIEPKKDCMLLFNGEKKY